MVFTDDFKIYIFKKEEILCTKTKIKNIEYHCRIIIDLGIPFKADVLTCSCLIHKELWLGTENGRILLVNFIDIAEKFKFDLGDFFTKISTIISLFDIGDRVCYYFIKY